jgi:hypothetical protein
VINRREVTFLLGGAVIAARAVGAQQKAMPVIGYIGNATPAANARLLPPFHQGLGETGFVEGRNVVIEYRWAEDRYDRLPGLAADLVGHKVDVIVSTGGITGALAAREASSEIPIVFVTGDDPVERGLVTSLARPGGNLTGVSFLTNELTPKRLEPYRPVVGRFGGEPQGVHGLIHRRASGSGADHGEKTPATDRCRALFGHGGSSPRRWFLGFELPQQSLWRDRTSKYAPICFALRPPSFSDIGPLSNAKPSRPSEAVEGEMPALTAR